MLWRRRRALLQCVDDRDADADHRPVHDVADELARAEAFPAQVVIPDEQRRSQRCGSHECCKCGDDDDDPRATLRQGLGGREPDGGRRPVQEASADNPINRFIARVWSPVAMASRESRSSSRARRRSTEGDGSVDSASCLREQTQFLPADVR